MKKKSEGEESDWSGWTTVHVLEKERQVMERTYVKFIQKAKIGVREVSFYRFLWLTFKVGAAHLDAVVEEWKEE